VTTEGFSNSKSRDLTIDVRNLIREYIRSYPTGITLIKEFIQNADDAEASELSVVLDRRHHPNGKMRDARMERLLGPSLLVSNNSQFTEPDHLAITTLLNSGKRKESGKTGRFGIGFNCCYNITDFPSYISGPDIVCLDPCYAAVRHEGGQRTIREALGEMWQTDPAWVRTFEAMGVENGCSSVPFTVFRLPLRMKGSDAFDPITPKLFTFKDFEGIVQDVLQVGTELLLFTKHLLTLKVGSIHEGETEPRWELIIRTTEPDKVIEHRAPLVEALKGDPAEVICRLKTQPQSPMVRYVHTFDVTVGDASTKHSWLVIGGLFRGVDDRLIRQAEAMLSLDEKAIPLAGCAARMKKQDGVERVVPVEGKLYCGLPMKRDTPLSFHVNAYFDTDSSRADITTQGGLQGDDSKRAEWNLLLLSDAIVSCAAKMMCTLVSVYPEIDAASFYKLFPTVETAGLFQGFSENLFKTLAGEKVVRVARREAFLWETIGNAWSVPDALLGPLIADGVLVAVPDPPSSVKSGFIRAGARLNKVDKGALRNYLDTAFDVDCDFEHAPKASLRRRDWIEAMFIFCYEPERQESIRNLPLAILSDGRLHTFGRTARPALFIATGEQRDLLPGRESWFVDPLFCETVKLVGSPNGLVRRMSLKDTLEGIGSYLGSVTNDQSIKWNPSNSAPPNESWLAKVFLYIANAPDRDILEQSTKASLLALCLVPDQFGGLNRSGQVGTPLLKPSGDAKGKLISSLSSLGIRFVTGSEQLLKVINQFTTSHPGFVQSLNPSSVASALSGAKLSPDTYIADFHDLLIDYFANAFNSGDLEAGTIALIAKLPIIPTTANRLVSAESQEAFLPPSFDIQTPFTATVVRRGPESVRVPLLLKLGVKELTLSKVISKFIAQRYLELTEKDRVELVKWVKDVYYHLERKGHSEQEELRAVREELGRGEYIKCSDGKYRSIARLYSPTASTAIDVLGEMASIPSTDVYSDFEESWADFFRKCGMVANARAVDILSRINSLITTHTGGEIRSKALLKIAKLLGEDIENISKQTVDHGKPLLEALKSIAWLPALQSDKTDENPAFTRQGRELFRPAEIYSRDLLPLVGNVHPVLADQLEPRLRELLGVQRSPGIGDVCKQLEMMSERVQRNGVKLKNLRTATAAFEAVHQFFGRDYSGIQLLQLNGLAKRFQLSPTILDKTGKIWLAKHVYLGVVSYFGHRRLSMETLDPVIAKGIERLGCKRQPGLEDLLEYLAETKHEFKESEIESIESSRLLALFKVVEMSLNGTLLPAVTPIFTQSSKLMRADTLFREDTSRFKSRIGTRVEFVDSRVPISVSDAAQIPLLSRCAREELVSAEPLTSVVVENVDELARRTRSKPFAMALQRLALKYLLTRIETDVLDQLQHLRVKCCAQIVTRVVLEGPHNIIDSGPGPAESFYESSSNTLFLSVKSVDDAPAHLAKAVLALVDPRQRIEAAALIWLMSQEIQQYEKTLDLLDAPPLPAPDLSSQVEGTSEESEIVEECGASEESLETCLIDKPDWDAMTQEEQSAAIQGAGMSDPVRVSLPTPPIETPATKPSASETTSTLRSVAYAGRESIIASASPDVFSGKPIRLGDIEDERGKAAVGEPTAHSASRGVLHRGMPGEGSNPFSPRRAERMISYVEPDLSRDRDHGQPDSDAERLKIVDAAVRAVTEYEKRNGRDPVVMAEGNPGYDVISTTEGGANKRFIEVKGTDGEWDRMGVGLTKTQIELARQNRQFWLYVVEWARTEKPNVFAIPNPYDHIDQFRFDCGWKMFADGDAPEVSTAIPATAQVSVGDRVEFTQGDVTVIGKVLEIKGLLRVVVIETEEGELIEMLPTNLIRPLRKDSNGTDDTRAER